MQMMIILTLALVVMTLGGANGNAASDWEEKYKSYVCNKGYHKDLDPAYVRAKKICDSTSDQWCYRACHYTHLGVYVDGKFMKDVANAHVANQFDSADNPLIAKWQHDTEECANKHLKTLPDYKSGKCDDVEPFVKCLIDSRKC